MNSFMPLLHSSTSIYEIYVMLTVRSCLCIGALTSGSVAKQLFGIALYSLGEVEKLQHRVGKAPPNRVSLVWQV